ncbi:MAG: aminotransferase class V-fold PLP-dependent enzyme [Elusimicrobiaceae bacterium]|nr:aminotransferase class V-fold PLP-dependent enzyme [Elusimicrobiaceae bacterium]
MKPILDISLLPTSTFACGPAQALPALRQTPLADTLFERSHRAPDIVREIYANAAKELRRLLDLPPDYTLCFFPGGANAAMDAVLWNLTKDTLSGLAFGEFSNRWAQTMASRLSGVKNTVRFTKPGELFPAEEPDPNASLVVLTPNETSTGVQIPNDYLTRVWQKRGPDTLVAWDATSCAGGRNLPGNSFDVLLFSLQKCFGAMGGTSVLVLSPRAKERLKQNAARRAVPYFLDLSLAVKHAENFQTVNTPNTTAIWLCYQAASWMNKHGGINAMDKLCRQHAAWLIDWANKTDFITLFVKEEKFRSYTTLTLALTDPQLTPAAINSALADTGLANLQDGLKSHPYAPANTLRVACFPFVDINGIEEYKKLTAALDEIVRQLRKK